MARLIPYDLRKRKDPFPRFNFTPWLSRVTYPILAMKDIHLARGVDMYFRNPAAFEAGGWPVHIPVEEIMQFYGFWDRIIGRH